MNEINYKMVQKYIKLGIVYACCTFYTFLCVLRIAYLFLTKSSEKFWQVKDRPVPPKCLNDKKYGEHKYLKSNVSI